MAPETKATFAQTIQAAVLALSPAAAQAIVQRTGPAWSRIAQSPSVSWLDEATYNALTEAIRTQLGAAGMQALFRQVGSRLAKNPGLQTLLESALRMLGVSPHSLLKIAPRGRDSVVRDAGQLQYRYIDARRALLVLRGFPVSTYRTGTTAILLSGTWLGLVDMARHGASARVALEAVDLDAGNTPFVITW